MSNLVPDSSCLLCMIACAVSEIFAVWATRRTSSYSGCGWLHKKWFGESLGRAMPLRVPKLPFDERDDGRELWDVFAVDWFNDLPPSAVLGLIVFETNFGLEDSSFLSLGRWLLRESGRHSVSIGDCPNSSSLLYGAFRCREPGRDGTIPASEDIFRLDASSLPGCNVLVFCSLGDWSVKLANCFLKRNMVLACWRFASSKISTSRVRSFLDVRSSFNCLSKMSAVSFLPYFCKYWWENEIWQACDEWWP